MNMQVQGTFSEAADAFINAAYWLTDEDSPLVTALVQSAAALDQNMRATLLAEFRQVYILLRRQAPEKTTVLDDLEDLLEKL